MTDTTAFPQIPQLQRPLLQAALRRRIDQKTKPLGALGRIEELAQQLGMILDSETPALRQPQMVVCAGDHGLAAHGVSAYPSDVTWQMVENFLAGGAAVSVLARQHGIALNVVDCGVRHDFQDGRPGLFVRKIAPGTADAMQQPAMTAAQCQQALANGRELLSQLPGNCVLLGEMGIGNTSSASMLMARLTGEDIAQCTGGGTGLDAAGIARKTELLRAVLQRHEQAREPMAALAAFGGFEVATLVGVVLQAASEQRVIVVDGFITTAAVLVAQALAPQVLAYCVFAHCSGERGHARMLQHLGARPLLDLGLRLGEGSAAALAWPLLESACRILGEMASFDDAGVSGACA